MKSVYFWIFGPSEQWAFVFGITGCWTNGISVQFFGLLGLKNESDMCYLRGEMDNEGTTG